MEDMHRVRSQREELSFPWNLGSGMVVHGSVHVHQLGSPTDPFLLGVLWRIYYICMVD